MFFKYVYGRIQPYPYLHIVTWGLPKRYFGLLRIFNLQIDEHPHHFLKQCSESLADYELPPISTPSPVSTVKSTPIISPDSLSTYEYGKKNNEVEAQQKLAQGADGNTIPPTRSHRNPKRKPVVSIKIKLNDDLRKLKCRSSNRKVNTLNQKNFLLVIEKSSSSKRDEYCLRIINNTTYSHSYCKLLKKNRKKKKTLPLSTEVSIPPVATETEKVASSTFSFENVYPPIKKIETNNYATTKSYRYYETNPFEKEKIRKEYHPGNLAEQIVSLNCENVQRGEAVESICNDKEMQKFSGKDILDRAVPNQDFALTLPSHLIPYEEPQPEEKPLRHWPILYQIFSKSNIEIYKNYFKPVSNDENEEDTDENGKENHNEKEDENEEKDDNVQQVKEAIQGSTLDKTAGIAFHNTSKIATSFAINIPSETNKIAYEEKDSSTAPTSILPGKRNIIDSRDLTIGISPNNTGGSAEPPSYFGGQTNKISSLISSGHTKKPQNVFTSSAFIQISADDEKSEIEPRTSLFHDEYWKTTYPKYSLTDSLLNMRLLSSSTKTYESITTTPSSQEEGEICDIVKGNGDGEDNLNKYEEAEKEKLKTIRKTYFLAFFVGIFLFFALLVILFMAPPDIGVVSRIMSKYRWR